MAAYSLSVLLLKETVKSPGDALKDSPGLTHQRLGASDEGGVLYWRASTEHPRRWVSLFHGTADGLLGDVTSATTAAVLFLKVGDGWFALTFGFGRSLLRPAVYEENFGLRVVLNSVRSERLRSVDAQSLEAVPLTRRSQSGRGAELSIFGLDVERDVLYAASGEPSDPNLGRHIAGKDSLRLTVPITLPQIPRLLQDLLAISKSDTYRQSGFAWVDNLSEVRDASLKQALEAELVSKIQSEDLTRTWLAPPEIIDWSDVDGFRYQRPKRGELLSFARIFDPPRATNFDPPGWGYDRVL